MELHVYYSRNRLLLRVWPETHLSTILFTKPEQLMLGEGRSLTKRSLKKKESEDTR